MTVSPTFAWRTGPPGAESAGAVAQDAPHLVGHGATIFCAEEFTVAEIQRNGAVGRARVAQHGVEQVGLGDHLVLGDEQALGRKHLDQQQRDQERGAPLEPEPAEGVCSKCSNEHREKGRDGGDGES